MKQYIVPYCIGQKDQWWSAVDIYNHNSNANAVTIKIYRHSTGALVNTIEPTIKPYQHFILTPDVIQNGLDVGTEQTGRAHITIDGPDNLMITPFMGTTNDGKNSGFGILPVFTDTILKN
jgi:hypothetical protein